MELSINVRSVSRLEIKMMRQFHHYNTLTFTCMVFDKILGLSRTAGHLSTSLDRNIITNENLRQSRTALVAITRRETGTLCHR